MNVHNFRPVLKTEEPQLPSIEHIFPQSSLYLPHSLSKPQQEPNYHSFVQAIFPKVIKRRRNIKLRLKSQPSEDKIKKINQRRGRYKRSTNNSHKKFICVARRLLMRLLTQEEKQRFDDDFQAFKNSRTYYFIILAHAKLLLSPSKIEEFTRHFVMLMNNKMDFYKKQAGKTDNRNFINFRYDQIADIQFALKAFDLYFEGRIEEAIEIIYKKEKVTVLKKHQFQQAIQTVLNLQGQLKRQTQSPIIVLQQKKQQAIEPIGLTGKKQYQSQAWASVFSSSLKKGGFERSNEMKSPIGFQSISYPLLSLQDSYPIFSHFFPTVFPYSPDNIFGLTQNLTNSFNLFSPNMTNWYPQVPPTDIPPTNSIENQFNMPRYYPQLIQNSIQMPLKIGEYEFCKFNMSFGDVCNKDEPGKTGLEQEQVSV